jgi:hypothetical protein
MRKAEAVLRSRLQPIKVLRKFSTLNSLRVLFFLFTKNQLFWRQANWV